MDVEDLETPVRKHFLKNWKIRSEENQKYMELRLKRKERNLSHFRRMKNI